VTERRTAEEVGRRRTPLLEPTDGDLLAVDPSAVATVLAELDWDFADDRKETSAHALHPYPAKFIPSLPRRLIRRLSAGGETILDPFSGGGTTGVEALSLDRRYVGIDANRVGNVVARAKTTPLSKESQVELQHLEAQLLRLSTAELSAIAPSWLPEIPNLEKWYDPAAFRALGVVRDLAVSLADTAAAQLALVAFINAASRVSFQDSETRYSSKPRPVDLLEVPRAFLSELRRMRRLASTIASHRAGDAEFLDGDARLRDEYPLSAEAVGLIVTSPPYPNAYDYHLYHRFRLFWLGDDPVALRRVEIGSHLKNQAVADPGAAYLVDMRRVLECCFDVLQVGRYAAFVVGDGLIRGEIFESSRELRSVAESVGFKHVATIDRNLPQQRRSVTKPGRRLTTEQILLLRRPERSRGGTVVLPNYRLFPYERDLQMRELEALGAGPVLHPDGRVVVRDAEAALRAAFVHGVDTADRTLPAPQFLHEAPAMGTRRKNSTYFLHGLHRYKGKFYPQLAKSLLNLSRLEPGKSLVVDPFGGSGTVALEAVLNGLDAVTIDCNPVAAATARAKTDAAHIPAAELHDAIARMRGRLLGADVSRDAELSEFAPSVLPELERWFPLPVLVKLQLLLAAARSETDLRLRRLFEVVISDLIREVSQQDPKDLRIRRRAVPIEDAPVFELFTQRLVWVEARIRSFDRRDSATALGTAVVVLDDSASDDAWACVDGRPANAVVSSPPYAAALPYIDTDRLSLAAVFGISTSERRGLEARMIGSREISGRAAAKFADDLAVALLPSSTAEFLRRYAAAIEECPTAGFRLRHAPAVLLRYFRAMDGVLAQVANRLERGAPCWLVLGNSRSTVSGEQWVIPTVDEVVAIANQRGFDVAERLAITVTQEDVLHSRHAITRNEIVCLTT
jgi:16S rRNA G966 N2-methylase RsmD